MTLFLSADHHFCHRNMLREDRDNRPFSSIEEHDETLIDNWNSKIKETDTVYYLGDLIWSRDRIKIDRVVSRLNGKIHLIEGNHDNKLIRYASDRFESIEQLITIKPKDYTGNKKAPMHLTLCHYPLHTWYKSCYPRCWHCHGHSHGRLKNPSKWSLDIGVMNTCWKPVDLDELTELMLERWSQR